MKIAGELTFYVVYVARSDGGKSWTFMDKNIMTNPEVFLPLETSVTKLIIFAMASEMTPTWSCYGGIWSHVHHLYLIGSICISQITGHVMHVLLPYTVMS